MRAHTTGNAKNSLIIGGAEVLTILQLFTGLVGFAHLNGLKLVYPELARIGVGPTPASPVLPGLSTCSASISAMTAAQDG